MGRSDFYVDLLESNNPNWDQIMEDFYFKKFGNLLSFVEKISDFERQKQGIDKILHFTTGESLNIDEKFREWGNTDDILLEEYSNWEQKMPGWMRKDLMTDYIVYVWKPLKKVIIFSFKSLRQAFEDNYLDWLLKYGRKFGKTSNKDFTYKTSNIPVPLIKLKNYISEIESLAT